MKDRGRREPATRIGLRVTDQETARAVAISDGDGAIVGAGCLLNSREVVTCFHVVSLALGDREPEVGSTVDGSLIGVVGQPKVRLRAVRLGSNVLSNDLALLEIENLPNLEVSQVQFSTPLRHGGKAFSTFGFPKGWAQGVNARGHLNAADAEEVVQMDGGGDLLVEGGFSGAPVWCPEVAAFIGIVVSEFKERDLAWCIPSRIISRFCPDLPVRFRMPPSDRPLIHDYVVDDPNVEIFGTIARIDNRRLEASVTKTRKGQFVVRATFVCRDGLKTTRGKYVTFITHPSFTSRYEDAYELFASIDKNGKAKVEFYPAEGFTLAAIGDAGDTALTIDLSQVKNRPSNFR